MLASRRGPGGSPSGIGSAPSDDARPLIAGSGLALLTRVGVGSGYARDVLPAMVVFRLGLSLTVAPLTSTVLSAVGEEQAGIASAFNNAASRVAGLIAVAGSCLRSRVSPPAPWAIARSWQRASVRRCGSRLGCAWRAGGGRLHDPRSEARAGPVAASHHCALEATPLRCDARLPGG